MTARVPKSPKSYGSECMSPVPEGRTQGAASVRRGPVSQGFALGRLHGSPFNFYGEFRRWAEVHGKQVTVVLEGSAPRFWLSPLGKGSHGSGIRMARRPPGWGVQLISRQRALECP